jgi:hypothetical protein
MSQNDMNLADAQGAVFRADANAALLALLSTNSGSSRPSAAVQGTLWVKEVSATVLELYLYDGAQDVLIGYFDVTNDKFYAADGLRRGWGGTAGGSANAVTISTTPAITAYENGQLFACILSADNTSTTVTLAVDGLGTGAVKVAGLDPALGALKSGAVALFERGNSVFTLLNPSLAAYSPVGKHKIPVDAAAMRPDVTNGPTATDVVDSGVQYYGLSFPDGSDTFAHGKILMPSSVDESATVTFRPVWTAASGTGDVVWKLELVARGDGDDITATHSGGQTSTDTLVAAGSVRRGPESAAITVQGSPATNDVWFYRISRDGDAAGDTLAAAAVLLGFELYVTFNEAVDVAT